MRNSLITMTVLAAACGSCATTPSTEALLVKRHAVLVETPRGLGSGFPISDDAFLTAWHVVEGVKAKNITVNGWIVLEVVRLGEIDVALLYTGEHGEKPWPLAPSGPRPGQRVWKSGYGQGLHWWTEGIGTEDPDRVGIDIFPGDSGGPVFNEHGEVLGIVVGVGVERNRYGGPPDHILHHCWIVPMGEIHAVLPPDLFELIPPALPQPLPAPESAWDRFLRLREERLGY